AFCAIGFRSVDKINPGVEAPAQNIRRLRLGVHIVALTQPARPAAAQPDNRCFQPRASKYAIIHDSPKIYLNILPLAPLSSLWMLRGSAKPTEGSKAAPAQGRGEVSPTP